MTISVGVPVPGALDGVSTETVVALGVLVTVPEVVTPPGPEVLMPVDDVTVGVPVVTIVVAVVGV